MSLPAGWNWFRLDEVAYARLGKMLDKAKNNGPERRYLRNVNVRWFGFDLTDVQVMRISEDDATDLDIRDGDVLICEGGEPGRSAVWALGDRQITFQKALHRVRTGPTLLPHWLAWNLKLASATGQLNQHFTGSTIKHFPLAALKAYKVPVPPLSEQRRIADKLDTVLASVDAVNDRLARVAPLLKRFRQAVLAAATSGRLTEVWRGSDAQRQWTPATLDSICTYLGDGPFGSNLKSDDYTESGARVVRLENIGHLLFDRTKETFVSLDKYAALEKYTLQPGDLLFSSFVDEEVRVCEFPSDLAGPAINKADCFCIRADGAKVSRQFLAFRLACRSTYEMLKAQVHGATRPRINLRQLRAFEVALPTLEEQAEVVSRVALLFAYADRLEARLQTAQNAADRLTPALLAKAFRGELVPQDPNDEPASELLKRLAASRSHDGAPDGREGRRTAATGRGRAAKG